MVALLKQARGWFNSFRALAALSHCINPGGEAVLCTGIAVSVLEVALQVAAASQCHVRAAISVCADLSE